MPAAGGASAWHAEAQRLKDEIKGALDAYPSSPSTAGRPSPAASPSRPSPRTRAAQDDNIVRLQSQIEQVHDFVSDTERKERVIQDLRVQVAELLKERQQSEQQHEGLEADVELARRAEAVKGEMVASLRLTVAQMEKHQQRDAHEAAESKKLLEKKAESLQASVAQLTAERDALRAETDVHQRDAKLARQLAVSRDESQEEAQAAQSRAHQLQLQLDEAQRRVESERQTVSALEQAQAVHEMRSAGLEAERDGLQQEMAGLRDELIAASRDVAERDSAKAATVKHQREAEAARVEVVQLQARLKASEEEKAALVEKLESRRVEYDEEHRCAVPAFPDAHS